MSQKIKKLLVIQLLLISIIYFSLVINSSSYAQEEAPGTITNTKGIENESLERVKYSAAYKVLCRELTKAEKDTCPDCTAKDIKDQFLHREKGLVAVRALLVIGAGEKTEEILDLLPTEPKTCYEYIRYFSDFKEKYGDVLEGLRASVVFKIDDESAFKQAASKAYEVVFGIPKDKQEGLDDVVNFLKASQATTFSKMVALLVDKMMTPEVKQEMLFNALDSIDRGDLRANKKFVDKILSQRFTYETLMKLIEQIPRTKKTTPKR